MKLPLNLSRIMLKNSIYFDQFQMETAYAPKAFIAVHNDPYIDNRTGRINTWHNKSFDFNWKPPETCDRKIRSEYLASIPKNLLEK